MMPGGYVVRDANGYLYSRDNEDEARQAKVLTKDEDGSPSTLRGSDVSGVAKRQKAKGPGEPRPSA
jgi:hypothetical protein